MGLSKENVLCNTDERIFYLSDNIDNSSIGSICFNLLYLLQQDDKNEEEQKKFERKPIRIYINSGGGAVYDMWALIDIILNSKTPIYTYCTGYAMSAAFKIFLAGHKRFASKHATFLYHQMSCWRSGKYQDLVEDREEMDLLQSELETYVSERTKINLKQLKDVRTKKKDWYIHSEEALSLGIINEIM